MACQHQYLTGTSCRVPVTIKVSTSRSSRPDKFTPLQHLSHLFPHFDVERSFLTTEFRFFFCISFFCYPALLFHNSAEVPKLQVSVNRTGLFFFPPLKYVLQSVLFTLDRSMINLLPSPFSHTKPLSVSTFSPRQRADSHALYFSATARQCGCICPHPFCPLSVGYLIQLKSFPFPPSPPPISMSFLLYLPLPLVLHAKHAVLCSESCCSFLHFPSR